LLDIYRIFVISLLMRVDSLVHIDIFCGGQGETDAFNLMSSEVYINNVLELSTVSSANWGFDRPDWILAKSSIHTVPYSSY